jgi:Uma2 family endonuclease
MIWDKSEGSSLDPRIMLEAAIRSQFVTELRCTFGGRSIVPDISVFEWSRIPVNNEDVLPVLDLLGDWQLTLGELFGWLSFTQG